MGAGSSPLIVIMPGSTYADKWARSQRTYFEGRRPRSQESLKKAQEQRTQGWAHQLSNPRLTTGYLFRALLG